MGLFTFMNYGKSPYIVYKGRYAGERLISDRKGKHWAIKNLSVCQRNIKELNIKEKIPMHFCKFPGYRIQIVWRDNTESWIILPGSVTDLVIESLKNTKMPY